MKRFLFTILFILAASSVSHAQTVYLKSGRVIHGNIIRQNEEHIKIETSLGVPLTFYIDEIKSIDLEGGVEEGFSGEAQVQGQIQDLKASLPIIDAVAFWSEHDSRMRIYFFPYTLTSSEKAALISTESAAEIVKNREEPYARLELYLDSNHPKNADAILNTGNQFSMYHKNDDGEESVTVFQDKNGAVQKGVTKLNFISTPAGDRIEMAVRGRSDDDNVDLAWMAVLNIPLEFK